MNPRPQKQVQRTLYQPTVWEAEHYTPHLFSFDFSVDTTEKCLSNWLKIIQRLIPFLNALASREIDPEKKDINESRRLLVCLDVAIGTALDVVESDACIDHKVSAMDLYIRTNTMAHCVTSFFSYLVPSRSYLKDAFVALINYEYKSPENWWFLAHASYLLSPNKEEKINLLFDCAANLTQYKHHTNAIVFWLLDVHANCEAYPTMDFYERLGKLTPHKPWTYDGECASKRHEFIIKGLVNSSYFNLMQSELSDFSAEESSVSFNIPDQVRFIANHEASIKIELSDRELFKFAAHIKPPSKPVLEISIPGLNDEDPKVRRFNSYFKRHLRAAKFCNSEGFLAEATFHPANRNIFIQAFIDSLAEAKLKIFSDREEELTFRREINIDEMSANFKLLQNKIASLSGYIPMNAIYLFSQCLVEFPYGLPVEILKPIQTTVLRCLEINAFVQEIHQRHGTGEARRMWFSFADEIVKKLVNNPTNLLLYVGAPIKHDKQHSAHAIYVALKLLPTNEFQIIISNGGDAVDTFHSTAETSHPKDRTEYSFAAFAPFTLQTDEDKEALIHYIFSVISLQFTKASNDPDAPEYTFNGLLKNLYLRSKNVVEEEFFMAYGKKIVRFRRADIAQNFLEQFTGNCTVHNLKQAIKVLYDLDRLSFGLLEDTLMVGLDQIITQRKLKATSSSSRQALNRLDGANDLVRSLDQTDDDSDEKIGSRLLKQLSTDQVVRISKTGLFRKEKFDDRFKGITTLNNENAPISVPNIAGLIYQPVPADGNCLFYAVALYVEQDQQTLRNLIYERIRSNQDLRAFIELRAGQTYEEYLEEIRGHGWSANVEINELMRLLGRPIIIIGTDGNIRNRDHYSEHQGEPIFVYYNGHNHYDALTLKSGFNAREILTTLEVRTPNSTLRPQ